jgi:hypothetical protein
MHARTELHRRGTGRLLLAAVFAAVAAGRSMAAESLPSEWHVSTRGNDSWSGLLAAPNAASALLVSGGTASITDPPTFLRLV